MTDQSEISLLDL